ncbi:hypothetical protein [Polaromonas sp. P5_D5]
MKILLLSDRGAISDGGQGENFSGACEKGTPEGAATGKVEFPSR